MGELDNCENCGDLYVRVTRPICQNCYNEEEKQFQVVYEFMKKRVNRKATVPEIVTSTGVEEDLIAKFVKEQRLRVSEFPNLTYPCERCDAPISEGKLCAQCSNDLTKDLKFEEELNSIQQRNLDSEREKIRTYYAIDKTRRNR